MDTGEKKQLMLVLENSSLFQEASPELQDVYRELYPELFEKLGELRNEKVTMTALLESFVVILEFLIDKDFLSTLRALAPHKVSARLIQEGNSISLALSLEYFKYVMAEFPSMMANEGLTDERAFQEMGFPSELIQRITSGNITIGELLMMDPQLVLKNAV